MCIAQLYHNLFENRHCYFILFSNHGILKRYVIDGFVIIYMYSESINDVMNVPEESLLFGFKNS